MFDFIRRIISSGAPITDVNILTGSSDDDKLLAKISERVIMIVPAKPLEMYVKRSFLPVSSLAICGAIRPIKLMRPVTHIIDETINVAVISIMNLNIVTFTPKEAASSSLIDSIRICLYSKSIIKKPINVIKKGIAILSMDIPLRLPIIQYSMDASCFSGSAASFKNIRIVCATEWIAIPVSIMVYLFFPGTAYAVRSVIESAIRPPANAHIEINGAEAETATIANAAPALAPDETPAISGDARGFLNTSW